MRTSRWFAMTVAAALTAGGFTRLAAQSAESPVTQEARHARFFERAREALDLTDEQVAQIKAQLAAEKDNLKTLISRLHDARVEVRDAIQSPGATDANVREAAAKVGAVQSDLAVERLKLHRRISPILTPKQREKLKRFEARIDDFIDTAINRLGEGWSSATKN